MREAALRHLGRHEATRQGLLRVLDRRIARWARDAGASPAALQAARAAARLVTDALVVAGAVDDARFAERRAALHARAGRSARSSRALLAVAGVAAPLADEAASRDDELELQAAIAHARRRRLGPFAPPGAEDPNTRRRALASFARAGFASETARLALAMDLRSAQRLLERLRERD